MPALKIAPKIRNEVALGINQQFLDFLTASVILFALASIYVPFVRRSYELALNESLFMTITFIVIVYLVIPFLVAAETADVTKSMRKKVSLDDDREIQKRFIFVVSYYVTMNILWTAVIATVVIAIIG